MVGAIIGIAVTGAAVGGVLAERKHLQGRGGTHEAVDAANGWWGGRSTRGTRSAAREDLEKPRVGEVV